MSLYLKRLYADGAVSGVRVLRARGVHHFSDTLIRAGITEGWLSMGRAAITVHGEKGDVVYTVVRGPGAYCCHCGERLGDGGQLADKGGLTPGARHVSEKHPGEESPDPANPAGYRVENFWTGVNAGLDVEALSPEEAASLEEKVREAVADRVRGKHGPARLGR